MECNSQAPVLSVITPMYNESEKIAANSRRIVEFLDSLGIRWEYILVDDGSTDGSLSEARRSIGDNPSCSIIHYETNRGRGHALRQGFRAARGTYVITTEADLSWGTEVIGQLYCKLRDEHADIVIASVHRSGGTMKNVPIFRRLLSAGGNLMMRWAFGGKLTMISGMTRGYRREAIQSIFLEENRKEVHLEIVSKAQALGLNIVEISATIKWNPADQERGRSQLGILRFVGPHLLSAFQRASVRILLSCAAATGILGLLLVVVGSIHKVFRILPLPLPNLVIYGLILCVAAMLFGIFVLVSIQIRFVYRSIVHLQSQLKELQGRFEPGQDTAEEPPPDPPDENVQSAP